MACRETHSRLRINAVEMIQRFPSLPKYRASPARNGVVLLCTRVFSSFFSLFSVQKTYNIESNKSTYLPWKNIFFITQRKRRGQSREKFTKYYDRTIFMRAKLRRDKNSD